MTQATTTLDPVFTGPMTVITASGSRYLVKDGTVSRLSEIPIIRNEHLTLAGYDLHPACEVPVVGARWQVRTFDGCGDVRTTPVVEIR